MPAVAVNSMLDLIGGTPLVRLRHLVDPAMADVFCKCEQFNPGGSLKDRVALSMIEAAEREGLITPGKSVIIEPTSGNTGVGLALVAAAKRYKLILTMPDNMSLERRALLKAYGAELHLTPAAAVMRGAVERATELAADNPNAFMPQQFNNPANVAAHFLTTGPEIVAQMGSRVPDAFIHGVGAGFVPAILDRSVISEVRTISEEDAQRTKLALARREGLLVGISAGASVKIALDIARELGPGKTVVTILCDTGERYFSSDAYLDRKSTRLNSS